MDPLKTSPREEPLGQRLPLSPWLTARGMDWGGLTEGLHPETLPRGTALYQQGAPSDEMFLILEGRVLLECCHASGKKRAIYIVSAGMTIGEAGAMFGGSHDFRAVTVTQCRLFRIPAPVFRRRVEASPALALQVFQVEARKGRGAGPPAGHGQLSGPPCPRRPGPALPVRAARQAGAGGYLAHHPLYPPGDGRPAGVSRVAVSQCMGELARQGVLTKRKGLVLLRDIAALERCRDRGA
ncbi:MAG: Crp/Fnr family transcriptional regulator [Intestinimonas sp.]